MKLDAKIYVAGHTGMVGSAIHRALTAAGYRNLVGRSIDELDLTDQHAVGKYFDEERPEYVFLAAAKVGGIQANNTLRGEFIYSNLTIQGNVIHAAHRHGVKKLLFLGSSCIYPKLAPQPIPEEAMLTSALEPTNEPYAIAKIAGLKMCEAYHAQYGADFISAMPTNLYGTNDNFNLGTSHVLPALIRKFHLAKLLAAKQTDALYADLRRWEGGSTAEGDTAAFLASSGIFPDRVEVWGTGTPRREFLHVDDCASALLFLMEHYDGGSYLNVGCGVDITIRELAELIKNIVGFPGGIYFNPAYPDGTPRKLLDVSKIRELGWKPTIPLREGIMATYEWYVRQAG